MKKVTYDKASTGRPEYTCIIVLEIALLVSLTLVNIADASDSQNTNPHNNSVPPWDLSDPSSLGTNSNPDLVVLSLILSSSQTPGLVDPNPPK
jgi:hypothetical protein